ncbi:cell cycle checkpoint protein [Grosmannia clavigera kw1407]|uniref:Cell cycle checkpoint protein n=1 Tax=Grosmannia clavigera (strain kw1407 / UAMH 11150) TaxID=655863 RepID=F0XE05_GROCL|nr:cell cycle checkpoint protein [Grosmannia clavigera kw1407]EFX04496.1 cell cycle checkpoint protein [Grosmannia clavigera kw1407]
MAPRRKRNVLGDSDSEEDRSRKDRKNNLENFLFPSPSSNKIVTTAGTSTITTPIASPSPVRKAAVFIGSPVKSASYGSPSKTSSFRQLSTRLKTNDTSKSPSSSSDKPRKGNKGQAEEKVRSGNILALFSKQAEKAQNSPKKAKAIDFVADDIASDPISEDDDVAESNTVVSSYVGSRAHKRWGNTNPSSSLPPPFSQSNSNTGSTQPIVTAASQKFRLPARPIPKAAAAPAGEDNLRPWSERFAPVNLDELAVHKKKVADVRRWLEDVLAGRLRQRLLVVKGAAGTGKTTTLQLLARDLGLEILEWRNPSGSGAGASLGFTSAAVQFDEFLNRGSRFSQLDLDAGGSDSDDDTARRLNGSLNPSDSNRQRRKIILIEEFPNTFMRSSSSLTSFRNTVLEFLATKTPSLAMFAQRQASVDNVSPVIMVVSETLLTTTSASADSFTAHRLLGPEILRHPGTGVIEFNAIAPSLLARALEIVVQKEARKSGRKRTPGPQVLKRLGEVGDVRSAIASLEFLCVKGDDDGDWGAKVNFTKGRKGPKNAALTKGEAETLEMVSQREASLGVFHAVGKVVYNKREDVPYPPNSDEAIAETLSDYLAQYSRPKRSLVFVDNLIDETGTDTHTFITALHENYALSCEQTGPQDPQSSLDYINGCIDYLSESDLLCPTWDIFFGGRGTNRSSFGRDSGSHVLRQDEMAFQVAVRGLLFSLPSPVKRSSASHYQRGSGGGGGGADQFKMFYPMSLKLWRSREELEGMVDIMSSKLLRGEMALRPSSAQSNQNITSRALTFLKPKQAGDSTTVASSQVSTQQQPKSKWQSQRRQPSATDRTATTKQGGEDDTPPPLLSLGSSARKEMILERLPYMALIARGKRCSFGSVGTRDLEKIVSFRGIGAPSTSAEDADGDEADDTAQGGSSFPAEDAWATDKPTDDPSPRKRRKPPATNKAPQRPVEDEDVVAMAAGLPMYKLYLSDDDIEEVD